MTFLELYSKIDLKTLVLACALVFVARPFSAQSVGALDPGFGLNGQTFHLLGDGVNNTARRIAGNSVGNRFLLQRYGIYKTNQCSSKNTLQTG